MASVTEQLIMRIALVDAVTKPLAGINQQLGQVTRTAQSGMANLAGGGAAMVAGGLAIQAALMPAIEMDRALGEVASLGVAQDGLKALSDEALRFSVTYGQSATDFVRASYDIQSAIAGLSTSELPTFTRASAVLAAATKADAGTITNYMGTLYGIFEQQAARMGKANWVEAVAGKTATAVQMFKTTGQGMADAFSAIGANATVAQMSMDEQFAVLGMLQATAGGGAGGTMLKAFVGNYHKAGQALGLNFSNATGGMAPMVDILDKIKGKFGEVIDGAEAAQLKKAFGTDEAVSLINLLIDKTGALANSVNEMGKVKGMTKAEEMAAAMTDQWQRVESAWFAIRAAAFGAVLPAVNKVVGAFADGGAVVVRWTRLFPHLTKAVSYCLLAIAGLGVVTGAWLVLAGLAKLATLVWALTLGRLKIASLLARMGTLLSTAATVAWVAICLIAKTVALAFAASLWVVKAAVVILGAAFTVLRAIMMTLSAVLMANPIILIVLAIIALVAAVTYYWDEVKAVLADLGVFDALGAVFSALNEGWQTFTDTLRDISPFQLVGKMVNWLADMLNRLREFSGISIDTSGLRMPDLAAPAPAEVEAKRQVEVINSPLASYRQPAQSKVPAGGLGQQLIQANASANAAKQPPTRSLTTGDVNMYVQTPMSPGEMEQELWMTTRG